MPSRTANPREVLVVAGPAHGDILLSTPLISAVRRAYPAAAVDVLVYSGQADILEGNPDVREVLSASKHPGFGEYLRLLRRIFRRYDLAFSTKWTDRAVLYAVLAGRRRYAIVPPGRDAWKRRLTTGYVEYDHWRTHTLAQNAALAAKAGVAAAAECVLPARPEAPAVVDRLLGELRWQPLAVLHLNPGLPHKRWTPEGWGAVAAALDRRGFALVLTGDGSASELDYLEATIEHMPLRPLNLAGRLRFADLSELLRRAQLYVGTDTVASHLAAAAGTPTVALFGPEPPAVWGPWPRDGRFDTTPFPAPGTQRAGNVVVVQTDVPCATCRQGDCLRRRERQRSCRLMLTLTAEQVIAAIDALVDGSEGSTASAPAGAARGSA
ncbi:MAG TPA: glycosyltransferase family 9 protein [Woeseiaceae bacterium]